MLNSIQFMLLAPFSVFFPPVDKSEEGRWVTDEYGDVWVPNDPADDEWSEEDWDA